MVVLGSLMGLAEFVLPVFVTVVLAVVISIYRKGRARVIGFIGAVLVAAGFAVPSLMAIVWASAAQSEPGSFGAMFNENLVIGFVTSALPGLLRAAGFILVAFALFARRPSEERAAR